MRNNMRVLEEVQASLETRLDEVNTSLAAAMERLNGLLEEVLVNQQQTMEMTIRVLERVMRIDRYVSCRHYIISGAERTGTGICP